jgi:hypothetical protein
MQHPQRRAERFYRAALFDAWGGNTNAANPDLGDFATDERQMAQLESWLTVEDTQPAPLLSDAEIKSAVEQQLSRASETVKARCKEHYGAPPPVRRKGEGSQQTTRQQCSELLPSSASTLLWHKIANIFFGLVGRVVGTGLSPAFASDRIPRRDSRRALALLL